LISLQKVETKEGDTVVVVYFDELEKKEVCPVFKAYRTHKVANQKPAPVIIYDYYDSCKNNTSFSIIIDVLIINKKKSFQPEEQHSFIQLKQQRCVIYARKAIAVTYVKFVLPSAFLKDLRKLMKQRMKLRRIIPTSCLVHQFLLCLLPLQEFY
jgi:hypothetical protein